MRVVICGGGAIGASIAYFLSVRGAEVVVVERTGVACAASGKSGGFLALDWCDGTPLQALARRSFALHAELPQATGLDWGHRRMTTYSGFGSALHPVRGRAEGYALGWLSPEVVIDRRLGSTDSTAQVHPAGFTQGMMQAAQAHGAALRIGCITGLVQADGKVRGV